MRKIAMMIGATALFGLGGAALAQQQQQQVERPCMADAARLCPEVQPGGGAQMQCLKAHQDELSSACKKKVMQMKVKKMEREEMQKQQQPQQPTP